MNRTDGSESLVDVRDEFDFEMDLQSAARSRLPVLISGTPRCALIVAQSIANRLSRAERTIRVVSCDMADCEELRAALTIPPPGPDHPPRCSNLLLREVHALTQTGQSLLRRLIMSAPVEAPRVFASTSVSLYHRVKEGRFDADLYYTLNAIHIVTSDGMTTVMANG